MKLGIIVLMMLLAMINVSIALADHEDICQELLTGEEFGLHVVEHANEMQLNGEMNPGVHHNGYSVCVVD